MRTLPTTDAPANLSLRTIDSSANLNIRLAWVAVVLVPLTLVIAVGAIPALNPRLENHWFHFQIVSLVSLVAFILALTTLILPQGLTDARAFFIPLGLGGIAGIFLLHGLTTPSILTLPAEHIDHLGGITLFSRSDLVVSWTAPLSLTVGACFFLLASLNWTDTSTRRVLRYRSHILIGFAILYLLFVLCAAAFPDPFDWLNRFTPVTRFSLAAAAGALYLYAAWRFWLRYRLAHQRIDAALSFAAFLLAWAFVPMMLFAVWSAGWWLYHLLMLAAFCVALGAVLLEYEHARNFQLTSYFVSLGILVTALLALAAGDLVAQLFARAASPDELNRVRWSTTGIFAVMGFLLLSVLWLVIRRGDKLLRANNLRLREQQAELERGRLAARLVPIGVAMGESLDLERVLQLICSESRALFQVDTALIWFKQEQELVARAAHGLESAAFLTMRQPVQNNPLLGARVVNEKRAIYVNHAEHSKGVNREISDRFGIRAALGVPLLSENQIMGSLVLLDMKNPERFGAPDLEVARLFGQQAAQALTHARLYERIQQQTQALSTALGDVRTGYSQTLAALSAALDARDRETKGHSHRVTAYALLLADALDIRDSATRQAIEWGALLHDVGKIGVPDAILHKPGRLTPDEWQIMRRHPEIGYEILQNIPYLQPAFPIVRHHHERWDGKGYPAGLVGSEIPLPARIFALADTLDAITTDRPYRPAQSFAAAFAEISAHRATQFDPALADVFMTISEIQWRAAAD